MQQEAVLQPLISCLCDADADVSASALRAFHNLVMDEGSRLGRFGEPVRGGDTPYHRFLIVSTCELRGRE